MATVIELSEHGLVIVADTYQRGQLWAEMDLRLRPGEYSIVTEERDLFGRKDFHYLLIVQWNSRILDHVVHRGQPVTVPEIRIAVANKRAHED